MLQAKCQRDHESGRPFIRCIQTTPDFLLVCASDRQLNNAPRFAVVKGGSILSVDTTFNIGKFYVTLFSVRHMLVTNKRTGSPPVVIAAACLHWNKNFEAYVAAAARLIQDRPILRDVKFVGTDSDEALFKALLTVFSGAKHLVCQIHGWDNIQRKLTDLGMQDLKQMIYCDIFGERSGSERTFALVDHATPGSSMMR
ncbi:uncharacterized protein LOC129596786 [Paramacrobiotus metropolitanus]|uniref:uncharacterized protein LOC129596786 n=1 Tax=Paramacrobiotus metropolitanus TaxID=2943436 RepID=UPI002445C666|nr:uncharacterized protein LOC129596786 [Paramacrobiotus metropolitanus]